MKKLWMIGMVLALTCIFTGCSKSEPAETTENTESTENEPYIVSFEGTTIDGENWNSDSFADSKVTMINIWATYCQPCLDEMPYLGELAVAYEPSEFQIVGVISDVEEGAKEKAVTTANELVAETNADTYPHLLVGESVQANLVSQIRVVPTTVFVNQEGELLGTLEGALSKEEWENIINGLLEEQ